MFFCLAEEGNNQAMWETYADGAKEPLKFFDILVKGLTANKRVNGISYEDYENGSFLLTQRIHLIRSKRNGELFLPKIWVGTNNLFHLLNQLFLEKK